MENSTQGNTEFTSLANATAQKKGPTKGTKAKNYWDNIRNRKKVVIKEAVETMEGGYVS